MKYIVVIFIFFSPSLTFAQDSIPESGIASFYADGFNGRLTAFGEKFNIHEYTAAHRTLPYNSIVKVLNTANNKTVVVRINDRGPHTKNRILDLSPAAANAIDMKSTGVAKVKIEVVYKALKKPVIDSIIQQDFANNIYNYKIGRVYDSKGYEIKNKKYCLELSSSDTPVSAASIIDSLYKSNLQNFNILVNTKNKKINYSIVLGNFENESSALKMQDSLKNLGLDCLVKTY